jgi:hypothetical protein
MTSLLAPDLTRTDLARKRAYTPRHAKTSPRRQTLARRPLAVLIARVRRVLLTLVWHVRNLFGKPRLWWRIRRIKRAIRRGDPIRLPATKRDRELKKALRKALRDIKKGGQGTGKSGGAQRGTGSLSGTESATAHRPPAATPFSLRSAAPGEVPALPASGRAPAARWVITPPPVPRRGFAPVGVKANTAPQRAAETRPQVAVADVFDRARPYVTEVTG